MEDEPPTGCGRIYGFLQGAKTDAAGLELPDGVDQISKAPTKPVELPDGERVGGPEKVERSRQLGAVNVGAAGPVAEHANAAGGLKRVELGRGLLISA